MPTRAKRQKTAHVVATGSGVVAGSTGAAFGAAKLRDSYKEDHPAHFVRTVNHLEHSLLREGAPQQKVARMGRLIRHGKPGFAPLVVASTAAAVNTGARKYEHHLQRKAVAKSFPRYAIHARAGRVHVLEFHAPAHFTVLDRHDQKLRVHRDQLRFLPERKKGTLQKNRSHAEEAAVALAGGGAGQGVYQVAGYKAKHVADAKTRKGNPGVTPEQVRLQDKALKPNKKKYGMHLPNSDPGRDNKGYHRNYPKGLPKARTIRTLGHTHEGKTGMAVGAAATVLGAAGAAAADRHIRKDRQGYLEAAAGAGSGLALESARRDRQRARGHLVRAGEHTRQADEQFRHARAQGHKVTVRLAHHLDGHLPRTNQNMKRTGGDHLRQQHFVNEGMRHTSEAGKATKTALKVKGRAKGKLALSVGLGAAAAGAARAHRTPSYYQY